MDMSFDIPTIYYTMYTKYAVTYKDTEIKVNTIQYNSYLLTLASPFVTPKGIPYNLTLNP